MCLRFPPVFIGIEVCRQGLAGSGGAREISGGKLSAPPPETPSQVWPRPGGALEGSDLAGFRHPSRIWLGGLAGPGAATAGAALPQGELKQALS